MHGKEHTQLGKQQSETKNKKTTDKLIKYDRLKKMRYCNIIPSDLPKWVFLEQTEMVFSETETIFKWKRCSGRNGIAPTAQKCIETLEPETILKFRQHRFQILIKPKAALHKSSDTMLGYTGYSQRTEHQE